jgi:hypothetical protein
MQAYGKEKHMNTTKETARDYSSHRPLYWQCEDNHDGKVKYKKCLQAEKLCGYTVRIMTYFAMSRKWLYSAQMKLKTEYWNYLF